MGGTVGPSPTHSELIRELWPDKALYGSVMLFITGIIGIAYGMFTLAIDVQYADDVPHWISAYPRWITILLSAATIILSYVSLMERHTKWAFLGGLTGLGAFGMLGVGSLLSVIAILYALKSRAEGEDTNPETLRLTSDRWPDKSLAASLIMLMTGVVTLAWGAALYSGWLRTEMDHQSLFGLCGIVVGLMCFYACIELYFQRAIWVGVVAGIGGLMTFGFYVVGPMLSGASLVLLLFAWKEREFRSQQSPQATAAPAARPQRATR
jgi:hypothetical protein